MPRRIPDFPDLYWSWNYISSVGSLISVFGIIVFFYMLLDVILVNSLYFQSRNNFYVMVLNNKLAKMFSIDLSRNTYFFVKYNFFNINRSSILYSPLNKILYSNFIVEFIESKIWDVCNLDFKWFIFVKLHNLNVTDFSKLQKYPLNGFIVNFLLVRWAFYLIFGWTSLFLYVWFFATDSDNIKIYLKLMYKKLILNKFLTKGLFSD